MFNVQQITDRLASMSDQQLQQYAQMHKDDPYILPLAASEFKRRQQTRAAQQQQAPQQTVAEQDLAQMQQAAQPQQMPPQQAPQQMPPQGELPEQQGIGTLPAQNLATMADGGIVGYAKGGVPGGSDDYDYGIDFNNMALVQGRTGTYKGKKVVVDGKEYAPWLIHPEWYRKEEPKREAELDKRYKVADAAYFAKYGEHLPFTSGVRSRAAQQREYNNARQGGAGSFMPTNPAKWSGREWFHTHALDVSNWRHKIPVPKGADSYAVLDRFMRDYGLHLKHGAKDPVHYEVLPGWVATEPVANLYKNMNLTLADESLPNSIKKAPTEAEQKAAAEAKVKRENIARQAAEDVALQARAEGKAKVSEMSAKEAAKWKKVQKGFTDAMSKGTRDPSKSAVAARESLSPGEEIVADPQTIERAKMGGKNSYVSGDDAVYDPLTGALISGGVPQKQAPLAEKFEQGLKEAGASAANIPDTLWNMFIGAGAMGAYPIARASGMSPTQAKKTIQGAAADFSSPVGKLFGVENTAEYRNAPTQQVMDYIGSKITNNATWLSAQVKSKFGVNIPPEDIENMQEQLLLGAPKVAGAGRTVAGKVARGEYTVPTELPKRVSPNARMAEAAKTAEATRAKTEAPRIGYEPEGSKPQIVVNPKGEAVLPKPELVREAAEARARAERGLAEDQAAAVRAQEALDAAKAEAIRRGTVPTAEARPGMPPATAATAGLLTAGAANAGTNPMEGSEESFTPNAEGAPYSGYEVPETNMPADSRSDMAVNPFAGESENRKPPAASESAPTSKKKGFGLTDEDMLMLGLNLMMSPGGQSGSQFSQFMSDLGRSGIATLAARKEREKGEKEEAYKALLGDVYKAQIAQMEKPTAELQTLAALEDPKLMARYRQVQAAKDYGTTLAGLAKAYNEAKLLNKELTWEDFTKGIPRHLWDPASMPEGAIVRRRQTG